MTLLFTDSFDAGDVATKWVTSTGFSTSSTTRWGSGLAVRITGSSEIKRSFTASSQITVGGAFYLSPGKGGVSFLGDAGITSHISVARNSSGIIEVRRGTISGTLLATGTTFLPNGIWFYMEIQLTIADSGGTVKVRINGASTNEIDFTGDTRNGGTSTNIDQIWLESTGATTDLRVDDLYVLNSTGSSNTTFLGDIHVHSLSPNGNGTYSQLTGSDGNQTDNYLLVDEKPFSTSDYVGSATVGLRDTYTMADLPTVTQVFGLQNNFIGAKSDASAGSAKSALLINSTLYYGATRALSTSYIPYSDIYDTNPNTTAAWVASDVNNLEAGMEVA